MSETCGVVGHFEWLSVQELKEKNSYFYFFSPNELILLGTSYIYIYKLFDVFLT
jgi:hypothetical protein